jgi:hypothetical protein
MQRPSSVNTLLLSPLPQVPTPGLVLQQLQVPAAACPPHAQWERWQAMWHLPHCHVAQRPQQLAMLLVMLAWRLRNGAEGCQVQQVFRTPAATLQVLPPPLPQVPSLLPAPA